MVNQQILEGHWNEIKGQLKQKWGQLTDDDITHAEGDADELIGVIQRKTGQSRERIEHEIEEMAAAASSTFEHAAAQGREYAEQAAAAVRAKSDEVSAAARQRYAEAEQLIRQRPAESLAVAFGVGLITGVVVGLSLRPR